MLNLDSMPISQNLLFTATVQKDPEFDHPPGAFLIRRLASELTKAGWNSGQMDNWRDCGWSVRCGKGTSDLEVIISQIQDGNWILQVSPHRVPGAIGRLLGGKPSATAADIHDLALAVHRTLSKLNYLSSPQWRWDGFPDYKHSTAEPTAI
jgi:hypothetical protein